jgi:enoyl-CoA hydratase
VAIELAIQDRIATITINHPERLNALNGDRLRELVQRIEEASSSSGVRVIVLTGAGDRAFVAGADIKEMSNLGPEQGLEFGRLGHAAASALEDARQPVIAAVNGFALGGGCELALACDIRLAAENAVFAQPEVSLGIPPGWGSTQRLTRVVGPGMASEMIFSGRRVDAVEALRIGLVNAVYPSPELMPRTLELAALISANSPQAVQASKRLIALSRGGNPSAGFEAEMTAFGEAFGSLEQVEGMTAFLEKRRPEFANGQSE